MRTARRWLRRWFASALGLRGHVDIWWTPQLPIVYVNNPKCGCSTVKNSLKQAQAARFRSDGRHVFELRADPHAADDCLKRFGISDLVRGDTRFVISSARNPYTRILSAYLDKIVNGDIRKFPELGSRRPESFELFLDVLGRSDPSTLDPHFCPQYINLGLPDVTYDAIFYLENIGNLKQALGQTIGDFQIETYAPHSRGAKQNLQAFYTPRAIELVQGLYAEDFAYLCYSKDISHATGAPADRWTPRGIHSAEVGLFPGGGLASLKRALGYQYLLEARLI